MSSTPPKTKASVEVMCAPERYEEIQEALVNDGFGNVIHIDTEEAVDSPSSNLLLIGPGVHRQTQIDTILSRENHRFPTVLYAPEFKYLTRALGIRSAGIDLIPLPETRPTAFDSYTQRTIDILLGFVGLIFLLLPSILLLAPVILLTSRGGLFFSTTVVGENGEQFVWRKYRSMRPPRSGDEEARRKIVSEAIKNGGANNQVESTKVVDDERVTAIGKLIRKTSLDELPQLINVVQGNMSLVGPRPCLPYEYDEYNEWQRHRLDFKPGITGVWQVYGRSRVHFDEMVFMDVCGRLNRSILGDLKLILLTIPVALLGKGAE
jgi:lipopolysaccharide/colanic/teichoic acid biosynthesis glycosyltransferase